MRPRSPFSALRETVKHWALPDKRNLKNCGWVRVVLTIYSRKHTIKWPIHMSWQQTIQDRKKKMMCSTVRSEVKLAV